MQGGRIGPIAHLLSVFMTLSVFTVLYFRDRSRRGQKSQGAATLSLGHLPIPKAAVRADSPLDSLMELAEQKEYRANNEKERKFDNPPSLDWHPQKLHTLAVCANQNRNNLMAENEFK